MNFKKLAKITALALALNFPGSVKSKTLDLESVVQKIPSMSYLDMGKLQYLLPQGEFKKTEIDEILSRYKTDFDSLNLIVNPPTIATPDIPISIESTINTTSPPSHDIVPKDKFRDPRNTYIHRSVTLPDGKTIGYWINSIDWFDSVTKKSHEATGNNYSQFVTPNEKHVHVIANYWRGKFDTNEKLAQGILDFVNHSIHYDSKHEITGSTQHVKYPIETLVESSGDCEDSAILAASLMRAVNIDVVLLHFPTHVALGVNGDFSGQSYTFEDKKFYYAETTNKGWKIGKTPDKYKSVSARIEKIE